MSFDRPSYIPLHDVQQNNIVLPQDSPYILSGFPQGLVIPSNVHNGLWNSAGLWLGYIDCETLRTSDLYDFTTTFALTTSRLKYQNGDNVLAGGATVIERGAYLFEGRRFETDEALLNPLGSTSQAEPLLDALATTPGRIWIYLARSGQVRTESVAPATADTPGASEITLVGVDVDVAGVVTDGAVLPTTLPLPTYELGVVIPLLVDTLDANLLTADRIVGTGNTSLLATIEAQPTAGAASLLVTGNGSTTVSQAATNVDGSTGRAGWLRSSGTVEALLVQHTSSGDGVLVDTTGGTGSSVVINSAARAIEADSTDATADVVFSTTSDGNAIRATVTNQGIGVSALGGPSAGSQAVFGVAGHADAIAVQGQTEGSASTTGAGVVGTGLSNGSGVVGRSLGNGYGVIALADTTTPTRSAVRIVPQDNDPSTPLQGDFHFGSNRTASGKLRIYTNNHESVHSTNKGYVFDAGAGASGTVLSGNASGTLSLAQITPEEVGDVLVTVSGTVDPSTDLQVTTITLRDVTAAVTINGGGTGTPLRANDIDSGATSGRDMTFCVRVRYTLPSTATRTFGVILGSSAGDIDYEDVVVSVEGVL